MKDRLPHWPVKLKLRAKSAPRRYFVFYEIRLIAAALVSNNLDLKSNYT